MKKKQAKPFRIPMAVAQTNIPPANVEEPRLEPRLKPRVFGVPKEGKDINSLSKSGLTTFEKCPMQYKFGYLDNKWLPANYAMILGVSCHFAGEVDMAYKIDKGEDLKLSVLENIFESKWIQETAKRAKDVERTRFDPDAGRKEPIDPDKIFEDGLHLVRIFREQVADRIFPILTEVKFEVQVAGMDQGYHLKGVIDLVAYEILDWEKKTVGKRRAILDYKFKRNPHQVPALGDVTTMHDPKIYAAGYAAVNNGHLPAQTGIISIYRRELKKETQEAVLFDPFVPTQDDVNRALYRVKMAYKAIHAEAFCGASALLNSSMGCSPEACGHFGYCPAHL